MYGRDLYDKLNYTGMSKGVRQLAIDNKLSSIEEIAAMTELEICELVAEHYQLVYAENEEIGLVSNNEADEVFSRIKVISR